MLTTLSRLSEAQTMDSLREEINRLQNELNLRDELLEKREAEISSYLHFLSHEIKTPIVSMRGYATLLQENLSEYQQELGHDYLKALLKNVDRLETLVKDLLTLSGLNIQEKQFEEIDLNMLLDDIIVDLYGAYQFDGNPFKIQKNLPKVFGHKEGLRHVFTNLFVNSIKYKNEKRPLEIHIGCKHDEFFPKIYVRDNGIGIPVTARKRIFDMFARVGNKKGVHGSGIGLVIVQKIIEAHGGQIWLESKKGSGAVFYLSLPFSRLDIEKGSCDQFVE